MKKFLLVLLAFFLAVLSSSASIPSQHNKVPSTFEKFSKSKDPIVSKNVKPLEKINNVTVENQKKLNKTKKESGKNTTRHMLSLW